MNNRRWILFAFICVKFVLQYVLTNDYYDLHRDEYLHLDQGHHLAWGYESVPPFTSWVSWIIIQLGSSVFWVRFFPALFGCLTLLLIWKTIEKLSGKLFALVLGATAITISCLLRIDLLYQPNPFDIFAWTLVYYMVVNYIKTNENKWLYFMAMAFAIGFLNKYNIGFLIIGLVPAVLLSKHRSIFLNRHFYLAMALSLLLISPNLYWQYQHHFPVIYHMKELAATQLIHVQRSEFLKEQLLFCLNIIFVIVAALLSFFAQPAFKQYRLFFFSFLFTLFAFLFFRAKGYYALGLYPILVAFGAVRIETFTLNKNRRWIRPVMIAAPILLFLPLIRILFPIYTPQEFIKQANGRMSRWEDGKEYALPQDFADMLGWRELAKRTDQVYASLPAKETAIIICDNYGQAGAINYYSKYHLRAVSFNADYINWFDLSKPIRQVISIKEKKTPVSELEKKAFQSIVVADAIRNEYARENETKIYILSEPRVDINLAIAGIIEKRKQH